MTGSDDNATPERGEPIERARLLERVVAELPLGLCVKAADGAPLYANAAAIRHGANGLPRPSGAAGARALVKADEGEALRNRTYEVTRHAIVVDGARYEVATSNDVTDQVGLQEDLFRRAFFDDLTGLPNRGLLENGVRDLIEEGRGEAQLALALIDIDNFKHINDYYGRAVGDALLVKIARRIAGQIRSSYMLARLGGDEFAVLLTPTGALDELGADIERLSGRLKEPFFVDGHEIFSSASIGVSLYPAHGRDFEALRVSAGVAMDRAKGAPRAG